MCTTGGTEPLSGDLEPLAHTVICRVMCKQFTGVIAPSESSNTLAISAYLMDSPNSMYVSEHSEEGQYCRNKKIVKALTVFRVYEATAGFRVASSLASALHQDHACLDPSVLHLPPKAFLLPLQDPCLGRWGSPLNRPPGVFVFV